MTLARWLFLLLFLPATLRADEPRKALTPAETKHAFLKMLDRPKVEFDAKLLSPAQTADGLITEHLSFASQEKMKGQFERVPTLIVRPAKPGRYPAMIVLHGTGGNKEGQKSWLVDFARRGIIGVAIDARYHGERSGGAKGAAAYVAAITKAWQAPKESMEHPFYYDTCWDLWRLVDYLEARPEIDAKRIGMMGISMGGIETWMAASVDDRVAVAAPLIGVQSFRWSLDNEKWQGRANTIKAAHEAAAKDLGEPMVNAKVCRVLWSKVIPGVLDEFDCPNMLKLFAGRPLFIANGEKDGNCPIEGARIAFKAVEEAYAQAKATDKLKIVVEPVGHTVTADERKQALDFCEKWLKK
jgi:dienelactone hydrolase